MNKSLFFAFIISLMLPLASYAAEAIAVVDMEEVLKQSVAIDKIENQVKQKRKAFQEKVQSKEEELRDKQKKLAEQRSLLAKDAYETQVKEFQLKANEISRELQQQRVAYDKASSAAINEVKTAIAEIVNNLAAEKKFQLALPSGVLLYYTRELDITQEVITRLNKKLPSVKTKLP